MSNQQLQFRLRQLFRRHAYLSLVMSGGHGGLALLVALALTIWIDLMLDLPAQLRIACAAGAILATLLSAILPHLRRMRALTRQRLASSLDLAGATQGQILSGSDLSDRPNHPPDTLTADLATIAIAKASTLAGAAPIEKAAPYAIVRRPTLIAAGAALLAISFCLVAPRLVRMQWLRLIDPFGDHPPYSRIVLSVEPGNASVLYGQSLDIAVSSANGDLENAELIWQTDEAQQPMVLPMFRESGGRWRGAIAEATATGRYYIRTPQARSHRYNVAVSMIPQIQNVQVKVTQPAYTRRPVYQGAIPQDGLAGLAGTVVEFTVTANRPLSEGSLQFSAPALPTTMPASRLAPPIPSAMQVCGHFTITASGQLSLNVRDTKGNASSQPITTQVTVLKDARPLVRLLQPQPLSLATPKAILAVAASAEDDYGISRLQLYRNLNHSRPRPGEIAVPIPCATRADGSVALRLDQFQLRPGDILQFFARAEDNDAAGAKGAETELHSVEIISEEEMRQLEIAYAGLEALTSKYEEVNRRTESLKAQLADLEKVVKEKGADSPEARAQQEKALKAMDDADRPLDDLAKDQLPLEADKQFTQEIAELRDRIRAARQALGSATANDLEAKAREARAALEKADEQYQQQVMQPLNQFAKAFALKEDEARFVELYERQQDLVGRLSEYKGREIGDDPARKARLRDLEDQQREIRENLEDLFQKIASHITELPDDPGFDKLRNSAGKFLARAKALAPEGKMADSESALVAFAGSDAHQHSQDAAELMKKLLSQCNAMGEEGAACLSFAPQLSGTMRKTAQQLLAGMGLGKSGMGSGTAGYSARSNTLQNVGLYGSRPLASRTSQSGSGHDSATMRYHSPSALTTPGKDDDKSTTSTKPPGGATQVPVPAEYQRRVADYYQRVADELSSEPNPPRRKP